MKFPVRCKTPGLVVDATLSPHPLTEEDVQDWSQALGEDSNSNQLDAVELISSAFVKCSHYQGYGRFVGALAQFRKQIAQNSQAELLGVVRVTAPWLLGGKLAAFCQFRRTWCHHVVFDFLSVHPAFLTSQPREVGGLGTAALAGLSALLDDLKPNVVWAETTEHSVHFYKALFNFQTLADLVILDLRSFQVSIKSVVAKTLKKR